MNIEKSKNAKEAIEFFRTLFKGDVVIDGINLSEDTIQELIMDKLDIIERKIKYLEKDNKKNIPLKPLINKNGNYYRCPCCETPYEYDGFLTFRPKHCNSCGQKLNWEAN